MERSGTLSEPSDNYTANFIAVGQDVTISNNEHMNAANVCFLIVTLFIVSRLVKPYGHLLRWTIELAKYDH